jgi:uncharacterized protein YbjT (DUF2867 family)
MILITGATGTVGSALLTRLSDVGAWARGLVHSPSARGRVEGLGLEAVDGDFDEPDTLERAMHGCDHLFLLSPPSPAQPQREKAAIDTAMRAGVGHIVALSVMGASNSSPVAFGRWHAEIDDHLVASGIDYTILRPSGFMQVHLLPVDTIKAQGRWYGMAGDGPSGYIDVEDIATVAVEALTKPGHGGATYELTGPEALTMPQAAAQLSEVIGRNIAYIDLPAEQFRANVAQAGLPDWLCDALVALYQATREGHAATVTNAVAEVTGRPPRSYRQFAEAHREAVTS